MRQITYSQGKQRLKVAWILALVKPIPQAIVYRYWQGLYTSVLTTATDWLLGCYQTKTPRNLAQRPTSIFGVLHATLLTYDTSCNVRLEAKMCSDRPQDPAAPPILPFEMFTERVLNETKLPWQQNKACTLFIVHSTQQIHVIVENKHTSWTNSNITSIQYPPQ